MEAISVIQTAVAIDLNKVTSLPVRFSRLRVGNVKPPARSSMQRAIMAAVGKLQGNIKQGVSDGSEVKHGMKLCVAGGLEA